MMKIGTEPEWKRKEKMEQTMGRQHAEGKAAREVEGAEQEEGKQSSLDPILSLLSWRMKKLSISRDKERLL